MGGSDAGRYAVSPTEPVDRGFVPGSLGESRPLVAFALILGLSLALSFMFAERAFAASFGVTSTADAPDANPGDGECAAASGECTLRAAVQEANANGEADTINFGSGAYELTIAGRGEENAATGDLDVTSAVDIVGTENATTADGNGVDRVFDVKAGATVGISGLNVTGGEAQGNGGGILNAGTLTLTNTDVTGNATGSGQIGVRRGGGVYNLGGSLAIVRGNVTDNLSGGDGGGIFNLGGGAEVTDTTISGNTAGDDGGGISNRNGGSLALNGSTVSGNTANDEGGGIRLRDEIGPDAPTSLDALNSTISGNTAGDQGGGVFSGGAGSSNFENVTIAGNGAPSGGNVFKLGDGAVFNKTIVAEPSGSVNCVGTLGSAGNNLDSDGSCGFDQPTDVNGADPLLGPLQDNGGFTQTRALPAESPAIDAVTAGACPPPGADQRGVGRPQDGAPGEEAGCDIGAFELLAQEDPEQPPDPGEPPAENAEPSAVNDDATTEQGTAVDIPVLNNDTDPDDDPLTVEDIVQAPANGAAEINPDGTITYEPDPGFTGTDTFSYRISDGGGGVDTATVTVTVLEAEEEAPAEDQYAEEPVEETPAEDQYEEPVEEPGVGETGVGEPGPDEGGTVVDQDQSGQTGDASSGDVTGGGASGDATSGDATSGAVNQNQLAQVCPQLEVGGVDQGNEAAIDGSDAAAIAQENGVSVGVVQGCILRAQRAAGDGIAQDQEPQEQGTQEQGTQEQTVEQQAPAGGAPGAEGFREPGDTGGAEEAKAVPDAIAAADEDEDGAVSAQEARDVASGAVAERVAEADENGDGVVSEVEAGETADERAERGVAGSGVAGAGVAEEEVIPVLPDTGGASLLTLAAGALLVAGGLLARRIAR